MSEEIRYGKSEIPVYRLDGNKLLAARISVEVFGQNFLPAYTEGDNSNVVPTDTMKNFVHAKALEYPGWTDQGLPVFVARELLQHYPQMQRVRVSSHEVPFKNWSELIYVATQGEHGFIRVEMDRAGLFDVEAGHLGMWLMKTTGSAFAGFPRDEYTTLPERGDRPLFIRLDVGWRYRDPGVAEDQSLGSGLVLSAWVADEARMTFQEFNSRSIQHLVYEMGRRLFAKYPSLAELSFEAQNHLWDTVGESEGPPRAVVYTDPRPAHGSIGLRLKRSQP